MSDSVVSADDVRDSAKFSDDRDRRANLRPARQSQVLSALYGVRCKLLPTQIATGEACDISLGCWSLAHLTIIPTM